MIPATDADETITPGLCVSVCLNYTVSIESTIDFLLDARR